MKKLPLSRWMMLGQAIALISAVVWIYWPVRHGDWLWDDDTEITANTMIRSGDGIWRLWFQPGSQIGYAPVKEAVQWIQWHLWGIDPLGYHLTSIALHSVSALLLWKLFTRLELRWAWLGGLLFAVHPMMVESVAWISELKNTLSGPPFLWAMIFYVEYDNDQQKRNYTLAVFFFLVAMLCKPTMVLFPAVILLHAWWKRGRIGWKEVKDSAPFIVIALVLGVVALKAGTGYREVDLAGHDAAPGGFWSQVAMAGLTLGFYFGKTFWPGTLLPIYPAWPVNPPLLIDFLPGPLLAGILYFAWTRRRGWGRHALFGLGFFLIMLLPVLGLMATKYGSIVWSLDHLIYLPIIGLLGLTLASAEAGMDRLPPRFHFAACGGVAFLVIVLISQSRSYAGMFLNEETLWTYTLARNPDAWPARNNLGYLLMERGQTRDAIAQFTEAVRLKPDYVEAQNNLGFALTQAGQPAEAIAHFQAALQLRPDFAAAHYNWGVALVQMGKIAEAIGHYQEALRLQPDYAAVQNNWANALMQIGQCAEAVEHYEESLRMDPDDPIVHYNCGNALISTGRLDEAIDQYREAVRLQPNFAVGQNNLGNALLQVGRIPEAIAAFQEALRIDPNYADACGNLGVALDHAQRFAEALDQFQQAARLKPGEASIQDNWGGALAQMGRLAEAQEHFQAALALDPKNAASQFDWGNALLYAGEFPEAIEHYRQAVRLNPGYANAYGNCAVALNLLGRKADAIQQLKMAIQLDPANQSLRANLAKLQATPLGK